MRSPLFHALLFHVLPVALILTACASAATVTFATNGHSYEALDTRLSWADAQAEAVLRGGHLVTITSAAEQAFVVANFGGVRRFIGLNDISTEGTFEWVTGEAFSYSNWFGGEPNNSNNGGLSLGENVAELKVNGFWNDVPEVLDGQPFLLASVIEYSVPEPATYGMAAMALGVLALLRRHR